MRQGDIVTGTNIQRDQTGIGDTFGLCQRAVQCQFQRTAQVETRQTAKAGTADIEPLKRRIQERPAPCAQKLKFQITDTDPDRRTARPNRRAGFGSQHGKAAGGDQ